MAKRRTKVHMDATKAGAPLRAALCGWLEVEVDTDVTKVTCAKCVKRLASSAVSGRALATAARDALRLVDLAPLAPSAGPPPLLDPAAWAATCKGAAEVPRCGECALCAWEREAERWHYVSPWNVRHTLRRPEGAPVWGSLAVALRALVDWELHDRVSPSAVGAMLERCKRGDMGGKPEGKGDDPILRRAGEVLPVRLALERAFPAAHGSISPAACMCILLERTRGVLDVMTGYDAIAARHGVSESDVRAVARHGRVRVTVELAARGLIPMPKASFVMIEAVETCRKGMVANG